MVVLCDNLASVLRVVLYVGSVLRLDYRADGVFGAPCSGVCLVVLDRPLYYVMDLLGRSV